MSPFNPAREQASQGGRYPKGHRPRKGTGAKTAVHGFLHWYRVKAFIFLKLVQKPPGSIRSNQIQAVKFHKEGVE